MSAAPATGAEGRAASFPAGEGARVLVNARSAADAVAAVEARLRAGEGFSFATLNLDHLVKLSRSESFRRAYGAADIVTADGNPIVWLSRLAGAPVGLAAGSDLVGPLCAAAARSGAPVAFYGSAEPVLERAAARLEAAYPKLRVVHRRAPPLGFDPESAAADADIAAIRDSGARLCFVALGAPKQEIFAARAATAAPGCGFASIGAGLDFVAGAQVRAPRWVRRIAMEWVWRTATDPRRLARRYFDCALILPGLALDSLRQRRAAAP